MNIETIEQKVIQFFNSQSEELVNGEYVKAVKLKNVFPIVNGDGDLRQYVAEFSYQDVVFTLAEPDSAVDETNRQTLLVWLFDNETKKYKACPTFEKSIVMSQIRDLILQNQTTRTIDFVDCFERALRQIIETSARYVIDSYQYGGANYE